MNRHLPKPDYTALDLAPAPADRPYILMNMVMSLDGKAVVEGTEKGIGSKTDQRLMRELRVNADIVLSGAGTLRASGTSSRLDDTALEQLRVDRGKPRFPTAAVVSATGDLPLEKLFFTARDFDAVLFLAAEAPAKCHRAAEATGRPVVVLPGAELIPAMLKHMRHQMDAEVLLVEGGPTLNAQLFQLGVVDEYFVTLGPVIVGGRDTKTPVGGEASFGRAQLPRYDLVWAVPNYETGEVYCRYRRGIPIPAQPSP